MDVKKHLPRLLAALVIALAAATSFAPRAHAAAEIDDYANFDLLADSLERVVEMYENYDTGDPSDYRKARSGIDDAKTHARRVDLGLHMELENDERFPGYTFSAFYIEHMESALLIDPGSLSAGSKLSDLAGFDDTRDDLLELFETVLCFKRFLNDEYEALCFFDVPLADRVSYLRGAIEAIRSGRVNSFNHAVRQAQYTGTIEASGDDVAIDAAVPAILAGVTGIAVGAAGFAIAFRRRHS